MQLKHGSSLQTNLVCFRKSHTLLNWNRRAQLKAVWTAENAMYMSMLESANQIFYYIIINFSYVCFEATLLNPKTHNWTLKNSINYTISLELYWSVPKHQQSCWSRFANHVKQIPLWALPSLVLTLSLRVTRTCVNFSTVYNDTLVAKGLNWAMKLEFTKVMQILVIKQSRPRKFVEH